jgi:hypothetical protein
VSGGIAAAAVRLGNRIEGLSRAASLPPGNTTIRGATSRSVRRLGWVAGCQVSGGRKTNAASADLLSQDGFGGATSSDANRPGKARRPLAFCQRAQFSSSHFAKSQIRRPYSRIKHQFTGCFGRPRRHARQASAATARPAWFNSQNARLWYGRSWGSTTGRDQFGSVVQRQHAGLHNRRSRFESVLSRQRQSRDVIDAESSFQTPENGSRSGTPVTAMSATLRVTNVRP